MATNFPNSLDSLTNPVSTDQLNSPSHSDQHINANDAIEALQAKVGTDNSAVTTSHDYRIRQLELNPVTSTANKIEQVVVNGASEITLLKGQVVYASGSVGASGKLRVALSSNSAESTSSKTFGILAENIIPGGEGLLVSEGLLEGIDTTGANDGDPVWLGSTPGSLIFGLISKPVAPSHLVFLGIVVRGGHQNTGSMFVKIQNGFEIEELHNVLITDIQDKDALIYDDSTGLWKNYDLTQDFVSSSDVQNSLGDYIPLTALGQPSGPAELNPDGDLLIPQDKIIFEGSTADDHELTLQSPDVTSDIIVTLPNSTGTIALTSEIPSLTGYATETYADTAASNAQSAAETYADGLAVNYDPAGSASTAEGNANSYTDTQLLSYTPTSSLDSTVDGYGYLKSTDLSGYATETYVNTAVSDLISSAPETLDTLNELAAALGDDPNYATTITTALGDKVSKSGGDTIISSTTSTTSLIIKSITSQTANLFEVQNPTGGLIFAVSPLAEVISYRRLNVLSPGASTVGVIVKGAPSQTANLQEWQNSSGAVIANITPSGGLYVSSNITQSSAGRTFIGGTGDHSAFLNVSIPTASRQGIVIRANASQTANLQEWQDNAGTVIAGVGPNGRIFAQGKSGNTDDLLYLRRADNNVNFYVDYNAELRGNFSIRLNQNPPIDTQAYLYSGTSSRSALGVSGTGSTNPTFYVKGTASQTSNLTEWQNSAGTVLASVGATGQITANIVSSSNITTPLILKNDVSGVGTGTALSMYYGGFTFVKIESAYVTSPSSGPYLAFKTDHNASGSLTTKLLIDNNGTITVNGFLAGAQGLIVKGAASQTANLTEWRNNSGTVLAKVDATGAMFTTTAAVGTDTTQVATTAFVIDQIDASTQPGSLYQADAPTSPEVGQIWIESDSYSDSFDPNIIRRQSFTATLGQTIFTTAVSFIEGYEQVYFNGLLLLRTTDYTTSGGNTVTLIEAAAADDIIEVVTITNLNSVDVYTQAETDALLAANTSVAPLSISANTNLVTKKRYFVTSASALTLTLPASPALNDEIQILDASGNASTYNITVARNGNLINGGTGNLIIDNNGGWYTLLYTGNTYGWKVG
jgi:hypothetical protein